jgi:dihydrofolate reductase
MNMTLDGFMSGPHCELDWHFQCWNEEMAMAAGEQLGMADTILLGRVTYQAMAGYWGTRTSGLSTPREDADFADMMNRYTKIVFSKTLERGRWNNSRVVSGSIAGEIERLKREPGKDMIIYGSGRLVSLLIRQGLVDEYRIWVHPVVLGSGRPLFGNQPDKINLELLRQQVFSSGVVLLYYKPLSLKIMQTKILEEIEITGKEFIQLISSFSQEQINQVPFEGSWTAGQVSEHVIKSVSGVAYAIRGKVKPADRPADQNIEPIRAVFLDFTIKMKSPEFIIPGNAPYRKEPLILEMEKGIASIADTIKTSRLDEICLGFEFPGFGFLTRTEWIHFTLFHTQRHIHQLKNIFRLLQQGARVGQS